MEKSVAELREALLSQDTRSLARYVDEAHPREAAESFSQLEPEEIIKALRFVRKDQAISIFEFFSEETQNAVFAGLARKEMAEFLEEMSPDDRADLVKRLNPQLVDDVLALMAQVDREDIRRLASYREGTAGAIMTTDYACLGADLTVAEALEQLRAQAPDRETIYDIYVVDPHRRLIGVVHLKDLIVARPASLKKVSDVMEEAISVRIDDDPIDVARTISSYDLIAVPVTDGGGRLVGIVTVDDAMDLLDAEARDPSMGGDKAAASHLAYVERAAWAANRSRGLFVIALALTGIALWVLFALQRPHLAIATMVIGMPFVIALGVGPGTRCFASTVRDLVREQPAISSLRRNLLDQIWYGLPVPLAAIFLVELLAMRTEWTESMSSLLVRSALAVVAQVIGSAILGSISGITLYRARVVVDRLLRPVFLSLSDAVGIVLYVFVVASYVPPLLQ